MDDDMDDDDKNKLEEELTDRILGLIVPRMQTFYEMVMQNPSYLEQNGEDVSHFTNIDVFGMCHSFKTIMDQNQTMIQKLKELDCDS